MTEDELMMLRESNFPDKLNRVRDLFIFMAYTGLSYIGMCNFNFHTMTEKQGNTYYII